MADSNALLSNISDYIAAAAALGTAAFALVDASKAIFGGVSNCGFHHIRRVTTRFVPPGRPGANMLPAQEVLATLRANWMNGTALPGQKAIAKTLIKLRLDEDNAPLLAAASGVDKQTLTGVAKKLAAGKPLSQPEQDVFGRFDLIVTTLLDEAYQRADQAYRNWARLCSMVVALMLAVVGAWMLWNADNNPAPYLGSALFEKAVLAGLVATPIAPIAKDLTSGLAAGVKMAQTLRK